MIGGRCGEDMGKTSVGTDGSSGGRHWEKTSGGGLRKRRDVRGLGGTGFGGRHGAEDVGEVMW